MDLSKNIGGKKMRNTKRLFALLVVLFITIGTVALPMATIASASTGTETTQQTPYMVDYFSNLDAFGDNLLNTCSMVALEMLLMYYDCYWDDRLVDDAYMQYTPDLLHTMSSGYSTYASPGSPDPLTETLRDFFIEHRTANLEGTFSTYLNYCIDGYDAVSLHMRLITTAYGAGLLTLSKGGALSAINTKNLLEEYLYYRDLLNPSFSQNDWNIQLISYEAYRLGQQNLNQPHVLPDVYEEQLRAGVIESIQSGIPVCIFVSYFQDDDFSADPVSGHTLIAYDYDPIEDVIYCHYGWPTDVIGANSHGDYRALENETSGISEIITGYLKLVPTGEHVHSNDYVFADYPNGACSCQLPSHTHDFYAYGNQNAAGHYALCYCEYYELQEHLHNDTYVNYSSTSHYAFCLCGHSELQNHAFQAQGLGQKVCVYCGYTTSISPDTPIVKPLSDLPPIDIEKTSSEEDEE